MDIAERLLEWGDNPQDVSHGELAEYSFVAHDEIKNLRQQNAELVEALENAANGYRDRGHEGLEDMCRAAIAKATGGE